MSKLVLTGAIALLTGCTGFTSHGNMPGPSAGFSQIAAAESPGATAVPLSTLEHPWTAPDTTGARSAMQMQERRDAGRRAGPQREEGAPGDRWSYQVSSETPSRRDPSPASYVRIRNAYSTPILDPVQWRSWNEAYDDQQREIGAWSVETGVRCTFVACTRSETFDVPLTAAQLRKGEDVRVRLTSRSGDEKFLTVQTRLPRKAVN